MTNGAAALFIRTAYQNAAIYFGDTPLAPGHGVQPERQGGCAFGSLAFPGLRVLAAEVLFVVAEADLDGPATGVAGGGLGAGGGQVGGDEEVVGFGSVGVAHGGESNRLLGAGAVPEHVAGVHELVDGAAAHVHGHLAPVTGAGLGGELGWGG